MKVIVACVETFINKLGARPPLCSRPCKLTFDLLTLKVVSESRVTWATSMPILVFLGLSVLDFRPDVRDRQTSSDVHHRLMPPPYVGGGIISFCSQSMLLEICNRILGKALIFIIKLEWAFYKALLRVQKRRPLCLITYLKHLNQFDHFWHIVNPEHND